MIGSSRRKRGARGPQGPSDVIFSAGTATTSLTARYIPPGYVMGTAPTTPTPIVFNNPRVLTKIRYRTRLAGTGTGSLVFTVRKENAATAITLTVLVTATNGVFTLPAGVLFLEGEALDVELTKTGTITASPTDLSITLS